MISNKKSFWRTWLFCLLGGMGVFLSGCKGHYEKVEEEVGMQGMAKINCFLAAERFVNAMGVVGESYATLPEFYPSHDGMLCIMASALSTDAVLTEIDDWVYDGGTLVCFLQKTQDSLAWEDDEDTPIQTFIEYFGIDIQLNEEKPSLVPDLYFSEGSLLNEHYETDFNTILSLKADEDKEYSLYREFMHGDGKILVWSTAMPFTSDNLKKEEHATLFWNMVSAVNPEKVWFVYFGDLNFWNLLWTRGSLAIISCVLLLLIWIWYRAKRFGPIFKTVDASKNTLKEHLSSTGAFFARYQADALIVEEVKQQMTMPLSRKANMPINSSFPDLLKACEQQNVLTGEQLTLLTQFLPDNGRERLTYLQKLQALSQSL